MRRSLFLLILFYWSFSFAVADKNSTSNPTYKISIDAKLLSHFIERGLSMSDKDPALNASFLFNFGPQFRFGFWGSNISNVTSIDDNFWFKFLADIKIDFNSSTNLLIYLEDDHFYKSDLRNGQRLGLKLNYNLYVAQFEWMNNYEGTHTYAEYYNIGKLFELKSNFKAGGMFGFILQQSAAYSNYQDLKAVLSYQFNNNASLESGLTLITNESQFNGRGAPSFYLAFDLNY